MQGITEFLPISSDGHLVLVPWLLGWPDQGLMFDGAVHVGTLGAVVIYFRREWIGLIRGLLGGSPVSFGNPGGEQGQIGARRLTILLLLSTIPTAIIGLLLKGAVEGPLRSPEWAGVFLICTGLAMLASEFIGRRSRRMETITVRDSIFMGAAQGLAVLPGFSRSGSTIATGLTSGLTREASARLSFLMAVPAIAGAAALVLIDLSRRPDAVHPGAVALLIGAGVSFLTGLLALGLLMRVLRRGSLRPFVAYCIVAGAAIVIARLAGL